MVVYEYFKVRKLPIFDLNIGLWPANSALCVPYRKCSVSVHGTLWKVFCLCAQYTFLMYRMRSVLSLCRVHIYDVPSEKCCVCVHSTHFSYIVWKVFWDCAQYIFPIYRLVSVLFAYALRISEVMSGMCFLSVHSMTMLIVFFSIFVELFIMNMFQQVKLLMENSMLNSWSFCVYLCDVHDPNCGRRTRGSCIRTMHLRTPRSLRVSFWPKTKSLPWTTLSIRLIWHTVTSTSSLKWKILCRVNILWMLIPSNEKRRSP